jgi:hypothetical protein
MLTPSGFWAEWVGKDTRFQMSAPWVVVIIDERFYCVTFKRVPKI